MTAAPPQFSINDPVWISGRKGIIAEIGTWMPTGEALYVVHWWHEERFNSVLGCNEPLRKYTAWVMADKLKLRV